LEQTAGGFVLAAAQTRSPGEGQALPATHLVPAGLIVAERVIVERERPGEMALPAQCAGQRALRDGQAVFVLEFSEQVDGTLQACYAPRATAPTGHQGWLAEADEHHCLPVPV